MRIQISLLSKVYSPKVGIFPLLLPEVGPRIVWQMMTEVVFYTGMQIIFEVIMINQYQLQFSCSTPTRIHQYIQYAISHYSDVCLPLLLSSSSWFWVNVVLFVNISPYWSQSYHSIIMWSTNSAHSKLLRICATSMGGTAWEERPLQDGGGAADTCHRAQILASTRETRMVHEVESSGKGAIIISTR